MINLKKKMIANVNKDHKYISTINKVYFANTENNV